MEYTARPRKLDSYSKSLGMSGLDEFIATVTGQSQHTWDERLTARDINAYLRAGYGNQKCDLH